MTELGETHTAINYALKVFEYIALYVSQEPAAFVGRIENIPWSLSHLCCVLIHEFLIHLSGFHHRLEVRLHALGLTRRNLLLYLAVIPIFLLWPPARLRLNPITNRDNINVCCLTLCGQTLKISSAQSF